MASIFNYLAPLTAMFFIATHAMPAAAKDNSAQAAYDRLIQQASHKIEEPGRYSVTIKTTARLQGDLTGKPSEGDAVRIDTIHRDGNRVDVITTTDGYNDAGVLQHRTKSRSILVNDLMYQLLETASPGGRGMAPHFQMEPATEVHVTRMRELWNRNNELFSHVPDGDVTWIEALNDDPGAPVVLGIDAGSRRLTAEKSTRFGDYRLLADPSGDKPPIHIERMVSKGQLFRGQPLDTPPPAPRKGDIWVIPREVKTRLEVVVDYDGYQEFGGVLLPSKAARKTTIWYESGRRIIYEAQLELSAFEPNPDFEAIGAFIPDVPNGTPVHRPDAPGIMYIWDSHDKAVVPDTSAMEQLEAGITDAREVWNAARANGRTGRWLSWGLSIGGILLIVAIGGWWYKRTTS